MMVSIVVHLAVVLIQLLVGTNAGQLITAEKCPDNTTTGCIAFPPAKNQSYNFIDSIIVSYKSPWTRGVNLSLNCWPGIKNEGPLAEPVQLMGNDLFCSPCTASGTHKFKNLNVSAAGLITYPTRCWFALGPYSDLDLPPGTDRAASATTDAVETMTTFLTGGNFTLRVDKDTRYGPITRELGPVVWTNLSTAMKVAVLGGVYAVLLGALVGVTIIAMKKSRELEDPMNPVYEGVFTPERDGSVSYRPEGIQASDAGWARSNQVGKDREDVEESSSYPLLSGSGERRW